MSVKPNPVFLGDLPIMPDYRIHRIVAAVSFWAEGGKLLSVLGDIVV